MKTFCIPQNLSCFKDVWLFTRKKAKNIIFFSVQDIGEDFRAHISILVIFWYITCQNFTLKQYQLVFYQNQCLQLQIFKSTIHFLKNVLSYPLSFLSFPGGVQMCACSSSSSCVIYIRLWLSSWCFSRLPISSQASVWWIFQTLKMNLKGAVSWVSSPEMCGWHLECSRLLALPGRS